MFAKAPDPQRRRRFYLRLAAGALLLFVAWFWFGRKAEPLVAGQTVAYWLDRSPPDAILPNDNPLAMAGPEIAPALLAALRRNYAVRDLLSRCRGFLPRFLRSQPPPAPAALIRQVAAFRLGLMGAGASNAVPTLVGMLQKPSAEVGDKGRINQALGWIGPAAKQAVPALVAQLTDPSEWIRMTAAYSLLQIGVVPPEAAPALQQNLRDTGHVAALMAVALLVAQPTPESLALVELKLTAEGDGNTRSHVAAALGWLPEVPGEVKPILTRMLEESNGSVRQGAAIGLARPHAEPLARIVERLLEGLREGQYQIRCAEALGKLGPDAAAARSDLAHAQGYVKAIIARDALARISTGVGEPGAANRNPPNPSPTNSPSLPAGFRR